MTVGITEWGRTAQSGSGITDKLSFLLNEGIFLITYFVTYLINILLFSFPELSNNFSTNQLVAKIQLSTQ